MSVDRKKVECIYNKLLVCEWLQTQNKPTYVQSQREMLMRSFENEDGRFDESEMKVRRIDFDLELGPILNHACMYLCPGSKRLLCH